jgi:hypothetical protein
MSDSNTVDTIARRSAARLTETDPDLPRHVEQALAEDPLAQTSERIIDPISLASLIVSIAALGWTIYHDIKKDRATAGLDQVGKTQRLATQLQQDGTAARLPAALSPEQRHTVVDVIAAEIIAADNTGRPSS